ncbi:MAG: T9SS type B sorting domain-containing protein [Bacteroidia bacterium]|nr:T9SS type B sorting domain-containing protein [Bacteroidia bacterium]
MVLSVFGSLSTGLMLILGLSSGMAQGGGACFTIDQLRGCAPHTIRVIDCTGDDVDAVSYVYDSQNCNPNTSGCFTEDTIYTFEQPGTYLVLQFARQTNTQEDFDTLVVEVLPSPEPVFEVSYCANREVFLQIDTSGQGYEQYRVVWGDNSPPETIDRQNPRLQHLYPLGGSPNYSLQVQGLYNPGNCGGSASQLLEPTSQIIQPELNRLETILPDSRNGVVDIHFTTVPDYRYEVLRNGELQTELSSEESPATATISNLSNTENSLCFQIRTRDACNNTVLNDDFYCSLSLRIQAEDGANRIRWTSYSDPDIFGGSNLESFQYVLFRNGQPIQLFTDLSTSEYLDTEIDCNTEYSYRIVAEFKSPLLNFRSVSNEDLITAFSTADPPPVSTFNATVESPRSILLFWQVPTKPRIVAYEIDRSGTPITSNVSTLNALDTDLLIDQQICYRISYTNECGNSAQESRLTCPVFLQAVAGSTGDVNLRWTPYINGENSFQSYVVQRQDEFGEFVDLGTLNRFVESYTDQETRQAPQILRYRIKTLIDQQNDVVSFSNVVALEQKFRIFFPNAFTPNGDGLNDIFAPQGLHIRDFKMIIYNRLGEQLFTSRSINEGWNGRHNGQDANQDVYIYVVELEDFLGEKFSTRGTFTLIR